MSNSFKTLNDAPYLKDDDFYRHFVNQISEEIKHSSPPKTIAITGYWGSGKTSALAQVYKALTHKSPPFVPDSNESRNNQNFVGIWFEAWRYQNEDQPIVALLQAIKQEFTWQQKFKKKASKLVDISFLGSLSILDSVIKTATGVNAGFKNLTKVAEKYEKDNLLTMLPTDMIHMALKEAIDELLKNRKDPFKKLVIFIDDLDRCQPQSALKLLEGLKLFLNIPNCVIVMAIDQSQLEHAIKSELADTQSHHFVGVEYLEKLCQDAHRLPLMSQEQGAALVENELNGIFRHHERAIDLRLLTAEISSVLIEFKCLPANPRRVKMIINRLAGYLRNWDFTLEAESILYPKGLVLLACLYVSYRQVYEQLEWDINFYEDLDDFANEAEIIDDNSLSNSSLDGLRQPKSGARYIGEPPSDLSVLRPLKIVQDVKLNHAPEQFKVVLKHLIQIYNGHQPAQQEEVS